MRFKFNFKDKLYVLEFAIRFRKFNIPTLATIGITNQTEDRKFVLFADYDLVNYSVVIEDYLYIQHKYKVGPGIIIATKEIFNEESMRVVGNYHLIVPTKFEFYELRKILRDLRCDNHFKKGWKYQFRNWVLRIGPKISLDNGKIVKPSPRLKEVFYSYTDREGSKAHIEFLRKYYKVRNLEKYYSRIDEGRHIQIIRYVTK